MARFIHTSRGKHSVRWKPYSRAHSATLGPTPRDLLQLAAGLLQGGLGHLGQVHLPGGDLLGGVQQVFGPEARPQGGQVLQGTGGKPPGGGEGLPACLPNGLPKGLAQPVDDPLDTGDVVVLGDDKRAQSLPGLLAQEADARGEGRRLRQGGAQGGEGPALCPVVGVQVEIAPPQGVKLPLGAEKPHLPSLLAQAQDLPEGRALPQGEGAAGGLFPEGGPAASGRPGRSPGFGPGRRKQGTKGPLQKGNESP